MDSLTEKAKKILSEADSGSIECYHYNNGFLDGIKFAESELKNCIKPAVSTSTLDDEKTPYCTDCGNDDLAYIDQYANGEYWKCKECGKEFIW